MGYSHGRKWNDELIVLEIKKMVEERQMTTFPTHSEIISHFGNSSLVCALSRHGGTKKFAEILGLDMKSCESKFGDIVEEMCKNHIEQFTSLSVSRTPVRFPYDLLVQNAVKIDVKSAVPFDNYGRSKYYSFNLEKKQQTCDIFVFYCMSENFQVKRTLIVPSFVLSGKTQFCIGERSKYNKYLDRWEIISDYYNFISSKI